MSFLFIVSFATGLLVAPPALPQAVPKACSLLTKELALKVTSSPNTRVFDLFSPEEEQVGASGSACEYGDIRVQIGPGASQQAPTAEYTAVPNVGDRAWFRVNRNGYAELRVSVGGRTLDIQLAVPTNGTAEQLRPKAIMLANALVPKLR